MRRWYQLLQQRYHEGRLRVWPVGLRIGWEFALPLALLIGTRMFFTALGAQSWDEGLQVLPDFGAWLWVISLLLLLGMVRVLAADISGTWKASFETQIGQQNYTYQFVVKDTTLTGKIQSEMGGTSEILQGKVEGDKV